MSELPTTQDDIADETAPNHTTTPSAAPTPPSTDMHPAPPPEALPHAISTPECEALLEIIRRGLAADADQTARANAREICGRIVQAFSPPPAPAPPVSLAPVAPAVPLPVMVPQAIPPAMPTSAFAAVVGMLRNMPPGQLFDLAIQRLRASLPQGATVPEPNGIQFQLVPAVPHGGRP